MCGVSFGIGFVGSSYSCLILYCFFTELGMERNQKEIREK